MGWVALRGVEVEVEVEEEGGQGQQVDCDGLKESWWSRAAAERGSGGLT